MRAPATFATAALLAACAPQVQPPGPLPDRSAVPALIDEGLRTADGTVLPTRRRAPADGIAPRGVVLALHGFNDYSNAFADIGAFLAGEGYLVYAYDQRGFGAAPHTGLWPGSRRLIDDFTDALAAVRARHPGMPLYALGESMGGAVMLAAWAERPYDADGTILVAPAVWGRATMGLHQTAALWLGAHTIPWARFSGRGLGIEPSDNVAMLRALGRDPLVVKRTRVDAIWGIVNLMDRALLAAARFDAPALLLYGARDEIVPPSAMRATLARLPAVPQQRRRVAVYDAGYHMLLRDLGARAVWHDIAAWLAAPDRPLPSGATGTLDDG